MSLPDSSILTNIQVRGHTRSLDILFEKKYIAILNLENRLYTDEEVMRLPEVSPGSNHYGEWQIRKRSQKRLLRYLGAGRKSQEILEIGCGNGWLSHRLAQLPGTRVTGLDINFTELQQAARIFSDDPNLHFIHGDIRSGILGDRLFDRIIFANAIQYFPSLKKILHLCLSYLKPGGEVHITDTLFYTPAGIKMAGRAVSAYYTSLGYPEMADFIFHHSKQDLQTFHYRLLYNPNSFANRLVGKRADSPWVCVKNGRI